MPDTCPTLLAWIENDPEAMDKQVTARHGTDSTRGRSLTPTGLTGTVPAMKELTDAIKVKQAQIAQLHSDIDTLQRAASLLGRQRTTAKAIPAQPKAKRKRRKMSAAAREALSKRMKATWAKRKRARR